MRYLLRSFLSVLLAFCMVFSNSYYAIANTTTEQSYDIQPYYIYDEGYIDTKFAFSLGDYDIMKFQDSSDFGYNKILPTHTRFDSDYDFYNFIDGVSSLDGFNSIRIRQVITDANPNADNPIFALKYFGYVLDVSGLSFNLRYYDESGNVLYSDYLTSSDFPKPVIKYYNHDANDTIISSGTVNLNDIEQVNGILNEITYTYTTQPASVADTVYVKKVVIDYYFPLPEFDSSNLDRVFLRTDFNLGGFIYGTDVDKVGSDDNYEKDVVGELGNIQSGIDNVVSSITNMANQAWQSAQQTVQSISNMTTQLTNTLNQQRQDILNGLGLLGDDITGTLGDVKTEITNMGSSITNKLESTTETITNTIETKVDEVTESVGEVKQSIVDLPNKLEEKALSLVVPEQEVIESKFSEIEDLLRGRFGLIYQAEEVIVDFANSLQTSTATTEASGGKIIFPSVVINLPDETAFNFGGYEVDLIPDGFETLANAVRLAVNMVCTAIFINMCKNKLEVIFK